MVINITIAAIEIKGSINKATGRKRIFHITGKSISFFLKLINIAKKFMNRKGANIRISVKVDSSPESEENAAIIKDNP